MQIPTSAKDAQVLYGDPGTYNDKATWIWKSGGKDARKYAADAAHDWAMFVANADLENQQWERNNLYNLPVEQYSRLISAGMNPLTAMESIAGVGSSAANSLPVSANPSASPGSGSEMAAAQRIHSALAAVGSVPGQIKSAVEARNEAVAGEYLPTTIRSTNDLHDAQAFLNRQQAEVVNRLADSEISAKAAAAKASEARAEFDKMSAAYTDVLRRYQSRQLDWFDLDKQREYVKWYQDLQESASRIVLQRSQARAAEGAAAASYSQAALNDVTRTQVIPAQVNLMGKQGLLYDKQGNLVDAQTFNTQVQSVAQRIENMHKATGMPYNCIGAIVVEDADAAGVFDEFGFQKKNHSIIESNSVSGRVINQWQAYEDGERQTAHTVANNMVLQQYINMGGQIVSSASQAVGAAAGVKNAFDPATRKFMNVQEPRSGMPAIGFTSP